MRIAVASDHAGFALKQSILDHLVSRAEHTIEDLGPFGAGRVDYPEYAARMGECIHRGGAEQGILICGTGIGISIAANKMLGIRAALCHDEFTARMARQHNDANVLCLGARVLGEGLALSVVDAYLAAAFEGGRHADRVAKIHHLETLPRPKQV